MVQKNNMKNHVTIAYTPNGWIHTKDQTGPLVSINDLTTLGSCRPEHFLGRMQSICEVEPLELWVMWVLGETPAMGVSLKMMSLELCFRRKILRDARWCIIRWHEHHEDHEHPIYPHFQRLFWMITSRSFRQMMHHFSGHQSRRACALWGPEAGATHATRGSTTGNGLAFYCLLARKWLMFRTSQNYWPLKLDCFETCKTDFKRW